jgi:hypothetical protein
MTQPFGLYEAADQDTVAPQITIGLGLPSTAEPGDLKALPQGSASDDRSGPVFTTLTVVTPEGDDVLAIDNRYTFAEAGEYSLVYRAVDGAGNAAETVKTVTVAEATDPGEDPNEDPTPTPTPETQLTDATKGGVTGPETATAGQTITITVGDEYAGDKVNVWVHSVPQLLGTETVSALGTVTVTLPSDLPAGAHKIVIQALDGTLIGWAAFDVPAGLAYTGAGDGQFALAAGLAVLAMGGILIFIARRRRTA